MREKRRWLLTMGSTKFESLDVTLGGARSGRNLVESRIWRDSGARVWTFKLLEIMAKSKND